MAGTFVFCNTDNYIGIQPVDLSGQIDHIPGQVYNLVMTPSGPILIKDRKRFDIPEVIYGDHHLYLETIATDFQTTEGSLGVILTGLKGSGKSLLAEALGNWMIASDSPVIMIDKDFPADLIKMVILAAGRCMVYFDEIGKVYSAEDRARLLTLFSDSSLKKVMFVATSNHSTELNDFFIDRPGRFRYAIEYTGVTAEVAEQMCNSHRLSADLRQVILDYTAYNAGNSFDRVSYDIMRLVVDKAKSLGDREQLYKLMSILNIPAPLYPRYNLVRVARNGEPVYTDKEHIRYTQKDYDIEFDIFTSEGEHTVCERFNIRNVQKIVKLSGRYGSLDGEHFDVILADGLVLSFSTNFAGERSAGRSRYEYTTLARDYQQNSEETEKQSDRGDDFTENRTVAGKWHAGQHRRDSLMSNENRSLSMKHSFPTVKDKKY